MDELAGTVIGRRYRLDRKLGEGGMGVVYSAFQLDLGREVAIKLMTHVTAEGLARFQREAHAAASLGNPHIVQVFDFQPPDEDPAFLVMELLNGPSLRELVKQGGPLAAERAARLFVQVLSALDGAHRAGIVHRDMKPANIVITSTPTLGEVAKVLDFGIAKLTNPNAPALTQDGEIVGTMAYMSPEQAGGGSIDARSDVYSLAATLFFALTGRRPVEARSADELYLGIIEGRIRPLASLRPDIDPALAAIVERALALDPISRFASAHEMADALSGWLQYRQTASLPPSAMPLSAMTSSTARPISLLPEPRSLPRKTSGKGIGLVVLLFAALFVLVILGVSAVGAYYFFVLPEESQASATPDGSRTPSGAPEAVAGAGTSPGSSTNTESTGSTPIAAARSTNAGPVVTATGVHADAAGPAPPATSATTPSTPTGRACQNASDCGKGAWSCDAQKCACPATLCGSVCTNLALDGSNCGACGKTCSGNDVCLSSACQTCSPPTRMMCGGVCIIISNNNMNCGGCGIKCAPGKLCTNGVCPK